MNFFKLYIGDYQRDTGTLSLTEHGAYMMMLQFYYATESPLPAGKELYRLLRAQNKKERDAIDKVSTMFWQATDEGLTNPRAWNEIEKSQEKAEHNREVGKRGGRPRKNRGEDNNPEITQGVIQNKPTHNPNQTPDTIANIDSVTNVTGAGAPLEGVWAIGLGLLSNAKVPERQARAMIGKWCKEFGQENVIDAIDAARRNEAANPVPYVEKVLKNSAEKNEQKNAQKRPQKLSEKNYSKGVRADGTVEL